MRPRRVRTGGRAESGQRKKLRYRRAFCCRRGSAFRGDAAWLAAGPLDSPAEGGFLAFQASAWRAGPATSPGPQSLRRAAWPGIQDSMPRAALLSIHARVEGDRSRRPGRTRSLVQLWGASVQRLRRRLRATWPCSRSARCPTTPRADDGRSNSPPTWTTAIGAERTPGISEAGSRLGIDPNRAQVRGRQPAPCSSAGRARGSRRSGWCPPPENEPARGASRARPPLPAFSYGPTTPRILRSVVGE